MNNQFKNVDIHKIVYKKPKLKSWDIDNNLETMRYYKRLKMLAISVFEWVNLPDDVDSVFLEKNIYEMGRILFFKDYEMINENGENPYLVLPVALNGRLNVYNIPMFRQAYAPNGYRALRNDKDSVIIYDNILKMTIDDIVYSYAERLAKVERIMDINLNNTRHPVLIKTGEKQKKLIEDLMLDINSNKPFVIADPDAFDTLVKGTEVFNISGEFVIDKLMDYKHSLMNEILTILGIGNSSQDKRERLVAKEMDIASKQNQAYAQIRLRARKQACKQINKMFGLNIDVKYSDELGDEPDVNNESVGDDNE